MAHFCNLVLQKVLIIPEALRVDELIDRYIIGWPPARLPGQLISGLLH